MVAFTFDLELGPTLELNFGGRYHPFNCNGMLTVRELLVSNVFNPPSKSMVATGHTLVAQSVDLIAKIIMQLCRDPVDQYGAIAVALQHRKGRL